MTVLIFLYGGISTSKLHQLLLIRDSLFNKIIKIVHEGSPLNRGIMVIV